VYSKTDFYDTLKNELPENDIFRQRHRHDSFVSLKTISYLNITVESTRAKLSITALQDIKISHNDTNPFLVLTERNFVDDKERKNEGK